MMKRSLRPMMNLPGLDAAQKRLQACEFGLLNSAHFMLSYL